MLRLKSGQRRFLVTHLGALGNLAAGSLGFGQAISSRPYSLTLCVFGIVMWAVLLAFCLRHAGRE